MSGCSTFRTRWYQMGIHFHGVGNGSLAWNRFWFLSMICWSNLKWWSNRFSQGDTMTAKGPQASPKKSIKLLACLNSCIKQSNRDADSSQKDTHGKQMRLKKKVCDILWLWFLCNKHPVLLLLSGWHPFMIRLSCIHEELGESLTDEELQEMIEEAG